MLHLNYEVSVALQAQECFGVLKAGRTYGAHWLSFHLNIKHFSVLSKGGSNRTASIPMKF